VSYSAAERQEDTLVGAGWYTSAAVGRCHVDHSLLQNIAPAELGDAVAADGQRDLLLLVRRRPGGAGIRLGAGDSLTRPPSENKLIRRTSLSVEGVFLVAAEIGKVETSPGFENACK